MTRNLLERAVVVALLAGLVTCRDAAALSWFTRYSPADAGHARRTRTDYIILHTTEGPGQGAYEKLFRNGEAHYLVDRDGRIRPICRPERVASHAGRSMWNGREYMDRCSIGIEVVGYHNGTITAAQYASLRKLLDTLQRAYGVGDSHVLTHSMVAYGEPNAWYARPHRGRKRCGMLFAQRSVRSRLGLTAQPSYDPDVAAGRLTVGDTYLASMLYRTTARPAPATVVARSPATGAPAPASAPAASASGGSKSALVCLGTVTTRRAAFEIAGGRWNAPSTLYRLPDGSVRAGNRISARAIPHGTQIFVRR